MNIIWERNMQNKLGNVIIEVQNGASLHVRKGWGNVLESVGFNVIYYNIESGIPINDLFDSLGDVKLFLGTTYNLNRPLIRQILKRPEMKIALYCSGHGSLVKELDLAKYPIQVITPDEFRNLEYIKKQVGCVHIHIEDELVEGYIGGFTKDLGIPAIGIMNAADTFVYCGGVYKEKYAADVSFVGGLWPYKAQNLDKTMVRLCRENWKNLNIKVFGAGWDVPQSLGNLPIGEDAHVFASAKICPNVSEPHSTDTKIADVVERLFKVPAAGGFVISDNVKLPKDLVNVITIYESYDVFVNLIEFYLKNEDYRQSEARRQKQVILENHTYFDRMAKLLNAIGMTNEAEIIRKRKTELIK